MGRRRRPYLTGTLLNDYLIIPRTFEETPSCVPRTVALPNTFPTLNASVSTSLSSLGGDSGPDNCVVVSEESDIRSGVLGMVGLKGEVDVLVSDTGMGILDARAWEEEERRGVVVRADGEESSLGEADVREGKVVNKDDCGSELYRFGC